MSAPLPIINGLGPSSQWLPAGPWKTVIDFLDEQFPHVERATWKERMSRKLVMDERGKIVDESTRFRAGACIFYYRELKKETIVPFAEHVLYRDEHILITDKPHFLPVIPSGKFLRETLLVRLRKQLGIDDLVPVHRLDRETAGLVLFSINAKTRGQFTSLFRNRKVRKAYEALAPRANFVSCVRRSRIVRGEPFFRMQEVSGDPNAETRISIVKNRGDLSLYQLTPLTGKKHQLRLHLASLGLPIINDKLYPTLIDSEDNDFTTPLKLLAKSISFQHPLTGRELFFESDRTL